MARKRPSWLVDFLSFEGRGGAEFCTRELRRISRRKKIPPCSTNIMVDMDEEDPLVEIGG